MASGRRNDLGIGDFGVRLKVVLTAACEGKRHELQHINNLGLGVSDQYVAGSTKQNNVQKRGTYLLILFLKGSGDCLLFGRETTICLQELNHAYLGRILDYTIKPYQDQVCSR